MNKTKSPTNKRPLLVVAAILAVLVIGGLLYYFLQRPSQDVSQNYAEEVARPIERDLVDAGGVKKTSGGDSGFRTDNIEPYYDAIYELPVGEDEAVDVIKRISNNNGYNLKHASPQNRGSLGAVADTYIDAWYFDDTSKKSDFSELVDGPIRIAFKIGDEDTSASPNHTFVRINVRLPHTK